MSEISQTPDSSRPNDSLEYSSRVIMLMVVIIAMTIVIFIRLFYLQIIKNKYYENQATNNREQHIPLTAFRGEIYDVTGKSIVKNVRSYYLYLVRSNLPENYYEREEMLHKVARVFNIDLNFIKKKIEEYKYRPYDPVEIGDHITFDKIAYLSEHREEYSGLYYGTRSVRSYPLGATMSHVIGYVGPITSGQYAKKKSEGYRINSIIGKEGVELYYDKELRGTDGYQKRIVNARNQVKDEFIPPAGAPIPGKKLILSIDHRIQKIAEILMEDLTGTVIVSRPYTGEILAMVSSPWYDPNIFTKKLDPEEYNLLLNDERKPFWNKTIRGAYPPSSIFKLVTALGSLNDKHITPSDTVTCYGGKLLENRFFRCTSSHGTENLYTAIRDSCNTYFYELGYDIGPNAIKKYANMLSFGEVSQIDLPWEREGLIPSPDWKRETINEYWWDGDTLNYAIGQGFSLVTPIQINNLISAIVNDGIIYKPHVVKEIRDAETDIIIKNNDRVVYKRLEIEKQHFNAIKRGLRLVVRDGTAKNGVYSPNIEIAGKTGTAQNVQGKDHSWFIAYAPHSMDVSEKTIVVTVVIEHGGSGGLAASPIATAIIRSVFEGTNPLQVKQNILDRWQKTRQRRANLINTESILGEE